MTILKIPENGISRYRSTFNPATGEHIQYVLTGRETAGSVTRFRWVDEPGGKITSHTHPGCSETFTILDGEAVLIVDGKEVTLQAGETAVVPPGAVHAEENRSGSLIHGVVELRPACKSAELHDALAGIGNELPHRVSGVPKNLLQLGATFWLFRDELRATDPPVWLQNLMLPPLAFCARIAGVQGMKPHWSSILPDDSPGCDPLFDESRFADALVKGGYGHGLHHHGAPHPH